MNLSELRVPAFLLATTTTEAPVSAGGGIDENLIQLMFAVVVIVGVVIAAMLYAASSFSVPWRRALSNTDRQALVNALLITGIVLLVATYTLLEPFRLQAAGERQLEHSIHRGAMLFGEYCVGCHGIAGTGGPVPAAGDQPGGFAPPLANRSDFRPESPLQLSQQAEIIRKTIARGRANTAMPPWSVDEGGALNSQDIDNLVDFIQRGDFAEVRNTMSPEHIAEVEATAVAAGGAVGAEGGPGKQLFLTKGCAGCHAIQGVSTGTVGPALDGMSARPQIAGVLPTNQENLTKWIMDPQEVKPGTQMPDLGVTQDEASQIAEYLLSLP